MSCNYFILTKTKNKNIDDNIDNQICSLSNNLHTFILPKNNIEYYLNNGLFESELIEWSKQYCSPNKIMLDIGAHTGTYSINLANICNQVYAFEPQKMTYYALCGSVALSNITNINCVKYGLGSPNQVGIQELMIISNDGGGSTLLNMNNSMVLEKEIIEIRTLDSFNLTNIGFIKMDVEDNELNVLIGSINTLKQSNYPTILFESNRNNTLLFEFLKNLSYNIINITGISNMYLATTNL